jgi:hypothetical protein
LFLFFCRSFRLIQNHHNQAVEVDKKGSNPIQQVPTKNFTNCYANNCADHRANNITYKHPDNFTNSYTNYKPNKFGLRVSDLS